MVKAYGLRLSKRTDSRRLFRTNSFSRITGGNSQPPPLLADIIVTGTGESWRMSDGLGVRRGLESQMITRF